MCKTRVSVDYDETNKEWNIFTESGAWFFPQDTDGFKTKKEALRCVENNPHLFILIKGKK